MSSGPRLGHHGAAAMSKLENHALLEVPFRVDLISEAPAPDGSSDVWQRYVISQGTNTINGLRPGARGEVASQLEAMVARLNERRMGKRPK
jgi:hypothetical protein